MSIFLVYASISHSRLKLLLRCVTECCTREQQNDDILLNGNKMNTFRINILYHWIDWISALEISWQESMQILWIIRCAEYSITIKNHFSGLGILRKYKKQLRRMQYVNTLLEGSPTSSHSVNTVECLPPVLHLSVVRAFSFSFFTNKLDSYTT